jgi:uncharacterized membrane protein
MSTRQERRPIEPISVAVLSTLEKVAPDGALCYSLSVASEYTPPTCTDAPVVVPTLEAAWAPGTPRHSSHIASQPKRVQVHVAQNLHELLATPPTQPVVTAEERHDLDRLVHGVLFVGLVISTVLMLMGMGLDMVAWPTTPIAMPTIDDEFGRLTILDPFSFVTVGLVILIATPITSVGAAILVLLRERDWRYVGITTLVLLILIASLLLGSD